MITDIHAPSSCIVHQRREEVRRRHQGQVRAEAVNGRVVEGGQSEQKVGVVCGGDVAQQG